jgi:cyclopropane-fatty-acyl-phospholipid synthase
LKKIHAVDGPKISLDPILTFKVYTSIAYLESQTTTALKLQTLSPKQVDVCRQNGLNAILCDWKELQPGELGKFDVVVSIGSFEHFCSVEEYFEGKRDEIGASF